MNLTSLRSLSTRYFPVFAIVAGLGLLLISGAFEYALTGNGAGFGSRKANVAVSGLVLLLIGIAFIPLVRDKLLFRWVMPSIPYRHPSPGLKRIQQILILAVWFGLLLGFSDLYYLANRKFLDGSPMLFAIDIVWMAPMGGVWIAGAIGGVLALVSWRWPAVSSIRTVSTTLAVPLYWNLFLIAIPHVHLVALFVLAVGFALITGRFVDRYSAQFNGLARRTTIPIIMIGVILTAAVLIPARLEEPRALAALPPAKPDAPNVLLITLDTVRAGSMSLYGYDRPTTPNLEQFAKRSVTFDSAISASSWTLPGHSSMFTGRWPHELSSDFFSPLDNTYPTLAEVLYANGYDTAGFTANLSFGPREYGLNRGMIHYEDLSVSPSEIIRSSLIVREVFHKDNLGRFTGDLPLFIRKDAEDMDRDFLGWLDHRQDSSRPFFGFINYFDAHEPYFVPPRFGLEFAGKERPRNTWKVNTDQPQDVVQELNNTYDGSIAYLDEQLGLLFNELERRGILDNTLVIVTADHGDHFGEHRILGHANSLYLQLIHVPLMISMPDSIPSDVRVPGSVTLRDIPATVADILNLKGNDVFPGQSLMRYVDQGQGAAPPDQDFLISEVTGQNWIAEWYPAQKGDMKSLVWKRKLYIKNADGTEELYDIDRDPLEEHNLIDLPESQPVLQELRQYMETLPPQASYH